jgi:hypothetical protein
VIADIAEIAGIGSKSANHALLHDFARISLRKRLGPAVFSSFVFLCVLCG